MTAVMKLVIAGTGLVAFLAATPSFAKVAKVELIDIDGETKTFTFFYSSRSNIIPSKLPGTMCSVDFLADKAMIELACMPTVKVTKKTRFTRTFTRAICDGEDRALLIVNTSANFDANSPMQAMSISATCE
jgi:hypothetical protein